MVQSANYPNFSDTEEKNISHNGNLFLVFGWHQFVSLFIYWSLVHIKLLFNLYQNIHLYISMVHLFFFYCIYFYD